MLQKFAFIIAKANQQDLTISSDLMKSGKVTLVIGRCYKKLETDAALQQNTLHQCRNLRATAKPRR